MHYDISVEKNSNQILASEPCKSVWVSASAGTGKTKILVDRIIRLLLKDIHISKILCITYTKAAAQEMKERLASILFKWKLAPKKEIESDIINIIGILPQKNIIEKAQSLHHTVYSNNNTIHIQTIHALCQSILVRFSLESSVPENFRILTSNEYNALISQIKHQVFFDKSMANKLGFMFKNLHDINISNLIEEICIHYVKFQKCFSAITNIEEYKTVLSSLLDVKQPFNLLWDVFNSYFNNCIFPSNHFSSYH